jgi:peptidoglycan/LPS O-acetylase OafA/YrhL
VFLAYPPAALFHNGFYWVKVFFILSGFVLPLNFFKTGKYSCLTGGVMRRYFRLMLPVLMILSIYLLFARFDCFGESTYNKIKNKTFTNLLYTAMFETWAGPTLSFIGPTWTLGIEFWATYLIYIVAFTAHAYRGRFFFYAALIFFFWSIEWLGFLNLVPWKAGKVHE